MKIQSRTKQQLVRIVLCLMLLCLVACRETLMHNLGEVEANTIVMHLHSAGIKAEKVAQADGNWSIGVRQRDSVRSMQALSQRRLLRKAPPARSKSASMLSSREEQKLQFERSLSAEMEYTLTAMPGVLDARVHLNLPERDPLLGEVLAARPRGSGSVLLVLEKGHSIEVSDIQRLVSGASGIKVDQIAVLRSETEDHARVENTPATVLADPASGEPWASVVAEYQTILSALIVFVAFCYGAFVLRQVRMQKKLASVADALQASEIVPGGLSS